MSLGEIVGMYEGNELTIRPEFQRLFRWDIGQKSKLIESILLGIPLPPIFVFEMEDGGWELIDGLQRLSTILEFMGVLRGPAGVLMPPSALEATRYLPSLKNAVWEKSAAITGLPEQEQRLIEKPQQLAIKRARIGVEILKRPSDNDAKYDLFQRLNAGGTPANAQELRNCIMLMVNTNYFRAVKASAESQRFKEITGTSDDQAERQRHIEYATRLLVHTLIPYAGLLDVEAYIDEGIIALAKDGDLSKANLVLGTTTDLLHQALGADALRPWDGTRHVGRVGLVGLEGVAVGVASNIDAILASDNPVDFVRSKVAAFWLSPEVAAFKSPGLRGTQRIQMTVPFGVRFFTP
ncbi:DUF262 domain-containing protein [Xanthomonas sp. CFBP 7912]|uniref:DUF262 domain-containing protein n=2 Tax=unclassified Xanthomonas TaxID=2643310 RepID=UPI001F276B3B|nr:DUF262 domain-containing protein [Xanthomonas sp. CFBP 7912]